MALDSVQTDPFDCHTLRQLQNCYCYCLGSMYLLRHQLDCFARLFRPLNSSNSQSFPNANEPPQSSPGSLESPVDEKNKKS